MSLRRGTPRPPVDARKLLMSMTFARRSNGLRQQVPTDRSKCHMPKESDGPAQY